MKLLKIFSPLIVIVMLLCSSCNTLVNQDEKQDEELPEFDRNNLLIVYPNSGKTVYFVDNQTFDVKKTINFDISENYYVFGMCLSTNKDYFVFSARLNMPPYSQYIASYHIGKGKIVSFFPTGLDSIGPAMLTAA